VLVLAEARKEVQVTTERMGGQYSRDLHVNCTHLVVQISFPRDEFFSFVLQKFLWVGCEVALTGLTTAVVGSMSTL
jgi:hypothetical protein